MRRAIDKPLLITTLFLLGSGFLIFSSASLGLLAREGARFSSVATNQFLFGIVGGIAALTIGSMIHYRFWRKYAFYILLAALLLTMGVFIPGLGMEHGGAKRWILLGSFSFQPSEFLKIAFVLYTATWLSGMQQHIQDIKQGLLPFIAIISLVGFIMLLQPDTDTFLIMAASGGAMFITAGGKWRHIGFVMMAGVALLIVLAFSRPYIMDRLLSFTNPSIDPQGASYQVRQSLIAVGSGGLSGRGFGQSIQKFEYLPEPIGDSVFAVFAEEFGFVGTVSLIGLFTFFALRGFRIATRAPDLFGTLLVVGFVVSITAQAFLNIAAMIALAPLSGLPLPFISHGGTALLATLASVGIMLNVSRYCKGL